MNKRRREPVETPPLKKRKLQKADALSEGSESCEEVGPLPMAHRIPPEVLRLILDLCTWYLFYSPLDPFGSTQPNASQERQTSLHAGLSPLAGGRSVVHTRTQFQLLC